MPAPVKIGSDLNFGNTNDFHDPLLSAMPSGQYKVVATENAADADLRYVNKSLNVNTFGWFANSTKDETQLGHAALETGFEVYVWSEGTAGARDVYAEVHVGGSPSFSPITPRFMLNSVAAGDQYRPEAAAMGPDRFLASWIDGATGRLQFGVYDIAGNVIAAHSNISNTAVNQASRHDLTAIENDQVVISYITDAGEAAFAIVDRQGSVSGTETIVGTESGSVATAALAGGGFVLVREEKDAQKARIYDASGSPEGADFDLATADLDDIQVTGLKDGRFMVVGARADGNVYARAYFRDGTPDGAEFQVNDVATGNGTDTEPAIVTLTDGRVVVAWTSAQDGDLDVKYAEFEPREAGLRAGASFMDDNWMGTAFTDTVYLSAGNDYFRGEGSLDYVFGEGGRDTLFGGAGDDRLYGGDGGDNLNGLDDADYILGGRGTDAISGGEGNDLFLGGGEGNDAVSGNDGNDRIDGGEGDDYLYGGNDNDYITGAGGLDTLYGDAGVDTLYGGADNDSIYGGTEADRIGGGAGNDTINGGAGNEYITGDGGHDSILGGAGLDTIYGGLGNDEINGGLDADRIDSGPGNNTIFGNGGVDYITGNTGMDTIYGGDGNDSWLSGSSGADTIYGDVGNDRIDGGADGDEIYGGSEIDYITAGSGNDTVAGGSGDDSWLSGEAGNDTIYGGIGADRLSGGTDNDLLYGGDGNDVITGGTGADTFVIVRPTEGVDTITDWEVGDIIRIAAVNFGGGLTGGPLSADRLIANAAPAPTLPQGQFLYSTATGYLSWDDDGTGANAPVHVMTLLNGGAAAPAPDPGDIVVF